MIRQAKENEDIYNFFENDVYKVFNAKDIKAFVNDKNFLHNDVDCAYSYYSFSKKQNIWFWKGIYIS